MCSSLTSLATPALLVLKPLQPHPSQRLPSLNSTPNASSHSTPPLPTPSLTQPHPSQRLFSLNRYAPTPQRNNSPTLNIFFLTHMYYASSYKCVLFSSSNHHLPPPQPSLPGQSLSPCPAISTTHPPPQSPPHPVLSCLKGKGNNKIP